MRKRSASGTAIAHPDSITASAVGARNEIGRAIAAKIRESKSAEELAVVAEDVLPEIEKFLESQKENACDECVRAGSFDASVWGPRSASASSAFKKGSRNVVE